MGLKVIRVCDTCSEEREIDPMAIVYRASKDLKTVEIAPDFLNFTCSDCIVREARRELEESKS